MEQEVQRGLQDLKHWLKQLQIELYEFRESNGSKDLDLDLVRTEAQTKAMEMYEKLDELSTVIEVKLECVSSDSYHNLKYDYEFLKERYQDVKVDLRETLLSSKSWTPQQEEIEKEEGSVVEPVLDDHTLKKLSHQEKLLDKNSVVTHKLQSINQLLQSSLLASEMNISDLAQSSASLTALSNKYTYFTDILVRSNKLVRTINESSTKERRQIYTSLYFFISVCAWILYKRILRKPIRLFFWLLYKTVAVTLWGATSIRGKSPTPTDLTIAATTTILSATGTLFEDPTSTVEEITVSTVSSILSAIKDEL